MTEEVSPQPIFFILSYKLIYYTNITTELVFVKDYNVCKDKFINL